jgi:hypothetical protein
MTPDPRRVGGLAWVQRTEGALTPAERRRLLGEIVRGQGQVIAGRIRLARGKTPPGAAQLAVADFTPPDSVLARTAEEACREQSPHVLGHSYRTWVFGAALSVLDRVPMDPERFYVASLLHDYGIDDTVAGQDFTLRSALRAQGCVQQAGGAPELGDEIGDAITIHATPGIEPQTDGALGCYVQAGAMLDLTGMRADEVGRRFCEDTNREHPRDGVSDAIIELIRAEARAVPKGRFALLHRCGFTMLVRAAPHRPR